MQPDGPTISSLPGTINRPNAVSLGEHVALGRRSGVADEVGNGVVTLAGAGVCPQAITRRPIAAVAIISLM